MDKKLTRRQKQFLTQVLDAYKETNAPIHYSELAEKLGISKVTTYEMLRLLEEFGLIHSEYEYPAEQRGPGRPSVVFSPTAKARQVLDQSLENPQAIAEWNEIKDELLRQLQGVKENGLEDLLAYLVARLPDSHNPLIVVTEFTTAILISLASLPNFLNGNQLLEKFKKIGLPGEFGLNAFTGVGLMLSGFEKVNQRFFSQLPTQIGRYEEMVSRLGKENILRICDFTRQAAQILTS